jgi:hypothetical protein
MRHAIIDVATGDVLNVILIEDPAGFDPGEGRSIRPAPQAGPGWKWNGATFVDSRPQAPAPVPASVDLWKARVVMSTTPWSGTYGGPGKTVLDAVQAAIGDVADPARRAAATQALEYANAFSRAGSLVTMIQHALGMTDEQADALFVQAAAIPS